MRRRVVTAALSVLGGALWASAALAASSVAPASKSAPEAAISSGGVANLNFRGVAAPNLGLGFLPLRPNFLTNTPRIQPALRCGRTRGPYGGIFPSRTSPYC